MKKKVRYVGVKTPGVLHTVLGRCSGVGPARFPKQLVTKDQPRSMRIAFSAPLVTHRRLTQGLGERASPFGCVRTNPAG
jgi:hypothetical protein